MRAAQVCCLVQFQSFHSNRDSRCYRGTWNKSLSQKGGGDVRVHWKYCSEHDIGA